MAERTVFVTDDAARDIDEICDYIAQHDSEQAAEYVFQRLKESILRLEGPPERGRLVPELERFGIADCREVFFKPYRILYFVEHGDVYVFAVFDGRRDLASVRDPHPRWELDKPWTAQSGLVNLVPSETTRHVSAGSSVGPPHALPVGARSSGRSGPPGPRNRPSAELARGSGLLQLLGAARWSP